MKQLLKRKLIKRYKVTYRLTINYGKANIYMRTYINSYCKLSALIRFVRKIKHPKTTKRKLLSIERVERNYK